MKISKLVSIGIGVLIATFIGCGGNTSDTNTTQTDTVKTPPSPTVNNDELQTPPPPPKINS